MLGLLDMVGGPADAEAFTNKVAQLKEQAGRFQQLYGELEAQRDSVPVERLGSYGALMQRGAKVRATIQGAASTVDSLVAHGRNAGILTNNDNLPGAAYRAGIAAVTGATVAITAWMMDAARYKGGESNAMAGLPANTVQDAGLLVLLGLALWWVWNREQN